MTVGDLKEILEGLDDSMQIELQHQPNYPLLSTLSHAALKSEVWDDDDEAAGSKGPHEGDDCLYLVAGSQLGYGNKNAWNK